MAYSKSAGKKYNAKCKTCGVRFSEPDMSEYRILEKYLSDNNTNFNAYARKLIHKDLIDKGLIEES